MKRTLTLLLLIATVSGCKDDKKADPEAPTLSTGDVFVITGRGTVATGTITSAGGYSLTEAGIVYGTNSNPSVNDVKVSSSDFKAGEYPLDFSVTLREGFPSGTTYYRSYAIGEGKAFYGDTKRRN